MKNCFISLVCALALSSAAEGAPPQSLDEVLTNASSILALSGDEASHGIPVSIRGVVTATEANWGGRFYVQDNSGGVFVENISSHQPYPGDLVSITGATYPGGYAPIISKPSWEKIGTAPLPKARSVAIEQLMSGAEDGQRIEISGIVRHARLDGGLVQIELSSGGYRVLVYAPAPPDMTDAQMLLGAEVDVRGTPATTYNAPLRHLISVDFYVPFASDFIIVKPAAPDPFGKPLTPLNNIAQYRAGRSLGDRVHVRGVVIYQRDGMDLFIKDATGGLQIKSGQYLPVSIGDTVDTVGFPEFDNFLPVLEDAVFKKTSEPRATVVPTDVPMDALLEGLHHAEFISIKGKLLDRLEEQTTAPNLAPAVKTILVLQASNRVFTAEAETAEPSLTLKSIPIGSIIEVSGICFLDSTEDGKIESFQVLLPRSNSVRILAKPGWLTAQHLLATLAVALVVIVVGTTWVIMVTKRNSALKRLIHERELDQMELQKAHDTLELRVKERTEQLKFEVTARKEAEVQFKATLTERTRLARELHDTIEQTMTGITLQLNTIRKLFRQDPQTTAHHLGLIQKMVGRSRVDLRRTIWDLRSRELEQFDLCKALLIGANRIADNSGIRIEAESKGNVRPLPDIIEDTLLRIGQEAVTNTVKHSGAGSVKIHLDFGDQNIVLEIKDNGKGFTPENCTGPNDGHFGILGMAERAKRVDGQISITSQPGQGTVVRVELPIPPPNLSKAIHEPNDRAEIIADSNPNS